jgi:hypothetical protein
MAKNTRTKAERERDLDQLATHFLRGKTHTELAALFGVSRQQITYDLKTLQQRWLTSALVNVDAAKAKELAKIEALERIYHEAWERSVEQKETKTAERTSGVASDRVKAVSRQEQRDGNPAFLAGIQWCIEQRCKALGIVQKPGTEVNVQVNNNNALVLEGITMEEFKNLPTEEMAKLLRG